MQVVIGILLAFATVGAYEIVAYLSRSWSSKHADDIYADAKKYRMRILNQVGDDRE